MVRFLRNSTRRIPLPVSTIDQKSFLNQLEAEEKSLVERKLPQNNPQKNNPNPESDPIQPKMAKKMSKSAEKDQKIEIIEDDRIRAHVKFLKRLGYKTELSDLHKKNPNFLPCHNNSPEEVFRSQDEFRMNSELKNIIKGGKQEHLKIAEAFQTLDNPCWKYIKVKSNLKTDQISVLASLNVDKLLKNEADPYFHRTLIQDCKKKLSETLSPLCTSLHIVSIKG